MSILKKKIEQTAGLPTVVFLPKGKELDCQFLLLAFKSYSDEWELRVFMKEIICFEMIVYVIFKRN